MDEERPLATYLFQRYALHARSPEVSQGLTSVPHRVNTC